MSLQVDKSLSETTETRDTASELRAWLATYSGMIVGKRDAENLRDFLKKTGWKEPS